MLGGCKREHGVQIKSASAEPGARSAPRTAKPCWGWVREGSPLPPRGPGVKPRKIFEIVNARR
jgi:hypothetical protein